MHLSWQMPSAPADDPVTEVSVLARIEHAPKVERLFFWALQVSFLEGGKPFGAGHMGLQYHPDYPGGGAVNWGGYHGSASTGSGELPGSALSISSTLNNPNTGDYPWMADRAYRYRIYRSPERGWRGSVTDTETGIETVIRDLWCPGSELGQIVVWTEAFAHCDEPSVAIQWSDFQAVTLSGTTLRPNGLRVNYQRVADGGCITTNSLLGSNGRSVSQITGTTRTTKQGTVLPLHVI